MKVQILGKKGCPRCDKLKEEVEKLGFEVEKINDLVKASEMGLMSAPGLAIDGSIKVQGRVPDKKELKGILEDV